MKSIVLVEDDRWLAELYESALSAQNQYRVSVVHLAVDGLAALGGNEAVDVVILDMMLPDHNGIAFLHEVASYGDLNTIPVIILSSVFEHDFQMHPERWKQYGVIDYLYKPETKPAALVTRVKKYFAQQSVEAAT